MNNLFKCNGCQKVMMVEEYNSHLCTPKPRGFKSVEIDYFRIIKGHMERTVILTKDMDGIISIGS